MDELGDGHGKTGMLFESRTDLVEAIATCFSDDDAAIVSTLIRPALALVPIKSVTKSWLRGDAMLPKGSLWPSVDGHDLVHTARLDMAGLPVVIDGQPNSGQISFFDGYLWMDGFGWGGEQASRHCAVIYTNGEILEERRCPLDPDKHEFLFLDAPTYLEVEGPYYTIPSAEVVVGLTSVSWGQDGSLRDFSVALRELRLEQRTLGQLFGNVSSIQSSPTPKPTNLRNDLPPSPVAWNHLATFEDSVGVFDYYFSVRHGDLADQSFTTVSIEMQCD